MTRKVIDVSAWQEGIDYEEVVASGVTGVVIKITEGEKIIDDSFYWHLAKAREYGLDWGVYCFSRATCTDDARAEANEVVYLLNQLDDKPSLGIWFDFESRQNMNAADPTGLCSAFISFCNANGYSAGVYANLSTFEDVLKIRLLADYVPYWCAQYGSHCDFAETFPNKRLVGWQYSKDEHIGETNVDMNKWYE